MVLQEDIRQSLDVQLHIEMVEPSVIDQASDSCTHE